jgi:hypothetical protein
MRRPVLLNTGGLDQLVYVPSSGPEIRRILSEVYGVDLINPPQSVRETRTGGLPALIEREVWMARSPDAWRELGREFRATHVLSRAEIPLQLHSIAQDAHFVLYLIPPSASTATVELARLQRIHRPRRFLPPPP